MEEEEIVFEAEDTAPGSTDIPGDLSPFSQPFQYRTRSGRTVKPVTDYIPTMGAAKKYNESVLHQVGSLEEGQRTPKGPSEGCKCVTYDEHSALVVGIVLQQMHINKAIKSML